MRIFTLLFLMIMILAAGQKNNGLQTRTKAVIPFQLINNLIFVPLNLNGANLTFLLDSGVNETLLFSLENKEVNFNNVVKVKFSGLGETRNIEGLKSDNNIITIGKDLKDEAQTVYIILDENINFSSHVGIPVNGIIGYSFFKNHPVMIDYLRQKITVYNDRKTLNRKLRRFTEFPISLEGNKPYMRAGVEQRHTPVDSKMLLDLGNSDAVWLFPNLIPDFVYNRPNIDDYLGQGFNGDIFGKRSRIHSLRIGDYILEKPVAAMPDEFSIQHLKLVPDRKGSIGNDVLRRFTVLFDYPESKLYLKPNANFKDPFVFNKSGLDIQHDGVVWEKDLVKVPTAATTSENTDMPYMEIPQTFKYNFKLKPQYSVAACRGASPCDAAGLRKGDKLLTINKKPAGDFTLQKIIDLLRQADGTKVTFEIERNQEKMIFSLILSDPIPYSDGD